MKKYANLFLVFLFVSTFKLYCQGDGALLFTTVQQSPMLLGAGQIGVSIPNDDAIGFYYNPAILGYSSRHNHASIYTMPSKTDWFFSSEYKFNNYGFSLGYNLKSSKLDLPISVGLGYIYNKFDYGEKSVTPGSSSMWLGKYDSYDLFNCFSLGFGIDYYIKLNLGLSIKAFESKIGASVSNGNIIDYKAEGKMLDYGVLLIFPISDLLLSDVKIEIDNSSKINPITNFSIGYSLANVGDEIFYLDEFQTDPLSRTARFGYTFEIGFDIKLNETNLNLINYSFTAEANDMLIKTRTEFNYDINYQSGFGDIDISENLFSLKSNDKVIVHRGHIFRFFDTLILTSGRFIGRGYLEPRQTNGIGFSSKGLFTLLNSFSNNTIRYFTNHFVIEYFTSDVRFLPNTITNFDGISIHFVGFEL